MRLKGRSGGCFRSIWMGSLDLEKLRGEITAMEGDRREMALASLKEACKNLDPDGDAFPYLRIIEAILKLDTDPVKKVLSAYHEGMAHLKRSWEARAMERLRRQSISGSALVPNLRADPAWLDVVSEQKAAFHKKLSTVIR